MEQVHQPPGLWVSISPSYSPLLGPWARDGQRRGRSLELSDGSGGGMQGDLWNLGLAFGRPSILFTCL